VPDPRDAEDILQDVFYELVEANRLLMPVERAVADEEGELLQIDDLLPSPDAGPEALYLRSVLLDVLELPVDELPEEQRKVFVAHELEGRSFKEMAAKTGVGVNTLLSRKRYAVRHLRERLQSIYDEFTKG
jgi:DNA-directed RNA polymerase specialized sigma24 family protein